MKVTPGSFGEAIHIDVMDNHLVLTRLSLGPRFADALVGDAMPGCCEFAKVIVADLLMYREWCPSPWVMSAGLVLSPGKVLFSPGKVLPPDCLSGGRTLFRSTQ